MVGQRGGKVSPSAQIGKWRFSLVTQGREKKTVHGHQGRPCRPGLNKCTPAIHAPRSHCHFRKCLEKKDRRVCFKKRNVGGVTHGKRFGPGNSRGQTGIPKGLNGKKDSYASLGERGPERDMGKSALSGSIWVRWGWEKWCVKMGLDWLWLQRELAEGWDKN